MTDDIRADEVVETQTPQEPMPSSDQISQEEEVVESVDQTDVSDDDLNLPEGVSERTALQFEKLRRQLAEEKAKHQSPFDSMRPAYQPSATSQLYDPATGYIDANALENLQKIALAAEQRAARTEKELQKRDEEEQTREALSAYPELDPKAGKKHDKTLYNLTSALILDSMVNPQKYGNKVLRYKEAADYVKGQSKSDLGRAEEAGMAKAIEQLTPKEQAALEATGRSDRRSSTMDHVELQERTRLNDYSAIMERLKNVPAA